MKLWIKKLKDSTQRDPILATVYQLTQQGWPHQRRNVPHLARRYWDFRDELSTDNGMLLKGPRLIIPAELQEEYLSHLHEGHLSASKVQENAKQHMYWTGIDANIEDYTKWCQECIKRSQAKERLQPHDIPEGPWRKLGINYFAFDGNSYVLICDYFSKFPFLYRAKTSFWSLRDCLIDLFSIEGYPDEIVSDNRPSFQSKEFAKFLFGLGIKHTTSSPGYPHSNGFIEWHIQTVKNMLSKSSNTRSFQEVLADLRTTCIGMGLPSPAEILHGRNLTTRVQAEIDIKAICSVLLERQLKMTLDHDTSRRARKARPLVVGERCHVLGPGNKWIEASLQVSLTVAEAMKHRWRPLGDNSRAIALTSDQGPLTYHIYMLLSYSVTRSLQQPVMEMHRLREKTRSFQDANSWLMAKRRSFQQTVREVSNTPIHLRS